MLEISERKSRQCSAHVHPHYRSEEVLVDSLFLPKHTESILSILFNSNYFCEIKFN